MNKAEFQDWFVDVLGELYELKAGFPIMLIVLPILERFLREKAEIAEGKLGQRFYKELSQLFPELDADTAKQFWQTYRNGLLHQLTFSLQNRGGNSMPPARITFDQDSAVIVKNNRISVNPILFSKVVIQKILGEFDLMKAEHSPNHPSPFVFQSKQDINTTGTASDESWIQ